MSSTTGPTPQTHPNDEPSLRNVGDLLSDITTDLSTLMRQEMALAKAEAKETATDAGKGAGMLGAAGVATHLALAFLSVALWWWLGDAIGGGWSAVVVAAIWALAAAILAARGRAQLRRIGTPMEQTTRTAMDIPQAMKGHEHR